MNPLTATPLAHLAHALGWTLLHFCWQGALVALLLACVLSLLSGRSAQPRYLAACCALAMMVALPLLTFTRLIQIPQGKTRTLIITTFNTTVTDSTLAQQSFLQRLAANVDHSMPAILTLWFAGVLFLLARLSVGILIARRMKSATTQPPPHELLLNFQHLAHRIGVSRPVQLLTSALVQVPTVIGWLRPVVLLPIGCLIGLSPAQIEAILAHELAHIRRYDYLVSVLQSIVEAVLFYHPAVWWVSQQIRREREHCCDDLAVKISGDPLTYARALSLLEERRSTLPTIALAANGGTLTMRIKRLLAPKQSPATSQLAALTLLGLVIVATTACITTAAHAQKEPATQSPNLSTITEDRFARQPATNTQQLPTLYQPQSQLPPQLQSRPIPKPAIHTTSYLTAAQQQSTPPAAKTIRVSGAVMAGQGLSRVNPIYPPEAKAARIQGAVVLRAVISKTGDISDLEPISGPEELRASALEAVRQWTYRPYILNGEPQEVTTTITINYSLAPPDDNDEASTIIPKKIGGSISAPHLTHSVDPDYTAQARKDKISGKVLLHLWVDEQGIPSHIRVTRGIDAGLDQKAIEAIRQYRFTPAMEDGKPVTVEVNIEVSFQLF